MGGEIAIEKRGKGVLGSVKQSFTDLRPYERETISVRRSESTVWQTTESPPNRGGECLEGLSLRWTAAGMLEAEKQFRKVIGYTDLPRLAVAIERRPHLQQPNPAPTQEATIAVTV